MSLSPSDSKPLGSPWRFSLIHPMALLAYFQWYRLQNAKGEDRTQTSIRNPVIPPFPPKPNYRLSNPMFPLFRSKACHPSSRSPTVSSCLWVSSHSKRSPINLPNGGSLLVGLMAIRRERCDTTPRDPPYSLAQFLLFSGMEISMTTFSKETVIRVPCTAPPL